MNVQTHYRKNLAQTQGRYAHEAISKSLFSTTGKRIASLAHDEHGRIYVHKTIKASIHALRTPPGLGMDSYALNQAKEQGAEYVLVLDNETGTKYWTPLETMFSKGFAFNRGFGHQIGLPWAFWHNAKEMPPGTAPKPLLEIVETPKPKQFDLFDQGGKPYAA